MKIVFDIESNDLLYGADRVWVICLKEINSDEVLSFTGEDIKEALRILSVADIIIGHNICMFDIPLLEKLYNFKYFGKIRDTYVMSKLMYPARASHALESYGIQFGREKPVHEDWSQLSDEMIHRCKEDVAINELTYKYLVENNCLDWNWVAPIKIEQQFAYDCAIQEQAGVDINTDLAETLIEKLDKEVEEIDIVLNKLLPKRVVPVGAEVKKPFKKDGSYSKMVTDWYGIS